MSEKERDRQFEALLDSLLSVYSCVEPRPGLELRVRARLKERVAEERRRLWWMAFAASTAAIFLAAWLIDTRSTLPGSSQLVVHKTAPVNPSKRISAKAPMVRPRIASAHQDEDAAGKTRALLLLANVAQTNNSFVLQDESSGVPASPEETQAPETPKPSTDNINIEDLGVESIDVKELTPRSDEKGTYDEEN